MVGSTVMREREYQNFSDLTREIDSQIFSLFGIFSGPVVQGVGKNAQFRSSIEKYYVGSVNSSTINRIMAAYSVGPPGLYAFIQPHCSQQIITLLSAPSTCTSLPSKVTSSWVPQGGRSW